MTPNPIISQLRHIRREQLITQEQLGKKAGYDRTAIIRCERGQHLPLFETVCNWAEALGYELRLVKK